MTNRPSMSHHPENQAMLLHYVLTLQWNDASAPPTTHSMPSLDATLTLGPAVRTTTEDGTLEPRAGMTSRDVYREVLTHVRTINAVPGDAGAVLHWSLSPNEIGTSTPLHYVLTLQQEGATAPPLATSVPGIGSIAAFKTGPSGATGEGTVEPKEGTTRQAVFRDVLAHVRTVNAVPDDIDASVLNWSLNPTEIS
ncbi:hypothetical protein WKI65_43715 [Streptomyces sp. MS1.AVA.3]|uniref:hypothetical protein n=1 Tax=Streptomyces decoyicus TaxID=249567 RepID=UPI0030BED648